jgi:hypothetical protein
MMRTMLTYEPGPNSHLILDSDAKEESYYGLVELQPVNAMPSLINGSHQAANLAVMECCDKTSAPMMLVPGNHDVDVVPELTHLSVGQLGLWQEYRKELKTSVRGLANIWQSLDMLMWRGQGINTLRAATGTEDANSPDPDQLDVRVPLP